MGADPTAPGSASDSPPSGPAVVPSRWGSQRIALVGIVVVVAVVVILIGALLLRPPSSGGSATTTPSPGKTPIGTAFEFGTPSQTSNGSSPTFCSAASGASDWCDVFPVAAAGGGITAGGMNFATRDTAGDAVTFTHGTASIHIESVSGASVATYSFSAGTWTAGATLAVTTTETFVLDTGCTVSGADQCTPVPAGLLLVALGVGSYSGEVQATMV